MPRGGKREGAGRKAGSKNRPTFELSPCEATGAQPMSAAERSRGQKRLVAAMVADGQTVEAIAAYMRMTPERLRALFPHELENGAIITRAEVLSGLTTEAEAGSVAALKALEELTSESKRSPKLGKKAAQRQTAEEACGRADNPFRPMPPPPQVPKIIVNNDKSTR